MAFPYKTISPDRRTCIKSAVLDPLFYHCTISEFFQGFILKRYCKYLQCFLPGLCRRVRRPCGRLDSIEMFVSFRKKSDPLMSCGTECALKTLRVSIRRETKEPLN